MTDRVSRAESSTAPQDDEGGLQRFETTTRDDKPGVARGDTLSVAQADRTERIRVGSGGVMLSHYSALKVAENFRVLETLYPGRIDLGIGRAPGSDRITARALANGPGALGIEQFPAQVRDVIRWVRDD